MPNVSLLGNYFFTNVGENDFFLDDREKNIFR